MIEDLDVILSEGESYAIEFKKSADKSLPSEVCAFANASGGRIFIGVDDRGKIVGTDVSNAARSRVQDTINQIEPRLNVNIVFLKKHLRMSFRIETLQRENVLELPEDALREAVVNAACHRDYFEKGARVMVEIYDDRVDIVSPGGVCKGITRENFGTVSITRNSVIASMFYRIGYIEQMGTGIMRMKDAAKAAEVSEPEFEFSGFFKATFKRHATQSTVASDTQATPSDTQATLGDTQATPSDTGRHSSDTQATLGDRKSAIITYLKTREKATAPDIAKLFGVTNGWARTILRQMAGEGTIKKVGDNRYAYYVEKLQ